MKRNIMNLVKRYKDLTGYEEVVSEEYAGASSFYMLPTGEYLNCLVDYGSRCDDHRQIFGATKMDYYRTTDPWKKLQCGYQIIRVVPEIPCLMIHEKQGVTKAQEREIKKLTRNFGFEVEYYL